MKTERIQLLVPPEKMAQARELFDFLAARVPATRDLCSLLAIFFSLFFEKAGEDQIATTPIAVEETADWIGKDSDWPSFTYSMTLFFLKAVEKLDVQQALITKTPGETIQ